MNFELIMLTVAVAIAAIAILWIIRGISKKTDVRFTVTELGDVIINRQDVNMLLRKAKKDGHGDSYFTVCSGKNPLL